MAQDIFYHIFIRLTGDYSTKERYAELDPRVFLTANDNWMEFKLRYVVDYKKRRVTKDLLYTRMLDEIDRTEGRVALASATFHLVETPEIKVRLVDSTKGGGA